ncbi:hypothetical protein MKW98_011929 [Papaver atlanticum]|uniref:DUF3615 domain-containing protein n=1 Tax=Papaver atlanticum TaxID=357466 RepID=A0AAD4XS72_9MAGN|nr:hypothetical protein MKW98_011929 [Papaver atlanticum]
MAVLRSGRSSSSSSNSQSLRSSDPALSGSKRLRLSVSPTWPSKHPKPIKGCTTKQRHDGVRPYATDAISAYNEITGTKYELVEPGFLTTVYIGKCILHHTDLTAKKTDVADAPEEMFFCRTDIYHGGDKNNGCRYCCTHNVHHPRDGGFKTGRVEV